MNWSPNVTFHRLALGALLSLLPASALAEESSYAINPDNSMLYALVYKAGAASAIAHDHVVRAESVEGQLKWDAQDPKSSSVNVTVEVAKLMPDADDMRKKVGLPNTLSSGQRTEILDHILANYQLDAATFSTITFRSTSVAGSGTNYRVTGDFTLRGVTKTLTVPMVVFEKDGVLKAAGKFRINQSDFGYKPYSALFGALKVKDYVDIVMKFELGA